MSFSFLFSTESWGLEAESANLNPFSSSFALFINFSQVIPWFL